MATTPQTNTTLAEIAQVIREHDQFVLCGHVSPDGDCLGSQLTLFHALAAMGKEAVCVLVKDEPIPDSLSFMPGASQMVAAEDYEGPCEVFVGVDVPNRERIGAATRLLDASSVSITIDHHASETTMCDHVYVDPDSASASILVWELVKLLVAEPPKESALCAYTGLVTDTGGFCFQNSDVVAFEAAADMVAYGVEPSVVARNVFQSRTLPSLRLEALALDRMHLICEGTGVISWVTQADMEALGAVKADVEPLVNAIRSLSGVRVACMLREQEGRVRGSLRAKDDTDVSVLARELGGGGHKAAAGLTVELPIEEAVQLVSGKIAELLTR